MLAVNDTILAEETPRDRLALLLKHFSEIPDAREPWRVAYPLAEVLLLVVCGTICSCDDFDDIAAWGRIHLDFCALRPRRTLRALAAHSSQPDRSHPVQALL